MKKDAVYKLIAGMLGIAIGGFALLFCAKKIQAHFGGNEKIVQMYEELETKGIKVVPTLDSNYTEIKILGATAYTVNYTFEVSGEKYKGFWPLTSLDDLSNSNIQASYHPDNPKINAIDVSEAISRMQNRYSGKGGLIMGIIVGIVGLLIGLGGISNILNFKKPEVSQ